MRHWLIKSEPDVFSIHDLARAKGKRTSWEGVRNYQARNFLRAMQRADRCRNRRAWDVGGQECLEAERQSLQP